MTATNAVTGIPIINEATSTTAGAVIVGATFLSTIEGGASSFSHFISGATTSTTVVGVNIPSVWLSSTFTDSVPPSGVFTDVLVGSTLLAPTVVVSRRSRHRR